MRYNVSEGADEGVCVVADQTRRDLCLSSLSHRQTARSFRSLMGRFRRPWEEDQRPAQLLDRVRAYQAFFPLVFSFLNKQLHPLPLPLLIIHPLSPSSILSSPSSGSSALSSMSVPFRPSVASQQEQEDPGKVVRL